jgi:hypothetical protein
MHSGTSYQPRPVISTYSKHLRQCCRRLQMQAQQFLRSPSQQLPGGCRRWLDSWKSCNRKRRNTVVRVLSTPRQTISRPADVLPATNSSEQNGKAINSAAEEVPGVSTERLPRHVAVSAHAGRWDQGKAVCLVYADSVTVCMLRCSSHSQALGMAVRILWLLRDRRPRTRTLAAHPINHLHAVVRRS